MSDDINTTPMTIEQMAAAAGSSIEAVERYLEEACGGYDRYVEICKDPKGLELLLKRLVEENGECSR